MLYRSSFLASLKTLAPPSEILDPTLHALYNKGVVKFRGGFRVLKKSEGWSKSEHPFSLHTELIQALLMPAKA